ncbi:hypothetical protein [Variovorax paradoxus]|uniref:hypothetical protein n=1 Tax=Variovorax paradoxus TaxID=34073 RepID=UPI0027818BF7|nr:hypothetical protein [Variovorax paradoxus]MDQ0586563.1 hypothetical protein [Variovorax paradoxus]
MQRSLCRGWKTGASGRDGARRWRISCPRGIAVPPRRRRKTTAAPCPTGFARFSTSPTSRSEIRRRIRASLLASAAAADLTCLRDDCFLLRTTGACTAGSAAGEPSGTAQLEELLAGLGSEPLKVRGMTALPRLHADWIAMHAPTRMGAAEIELALWAAQERLAPDVVVDCVDRVYDVHVEKKAGRLWLRGQALHETEERNRIEALFRLLQAECK